MALGTQVVDLVGLHLLQYADQVGRIGQVPVMQHKIAVVDVRILVNVVHPLGVERRGSALDAVHFVTFFQQQFREVGTVLAGDACDECFFHIRFIQIQSIQFFFDHVLHHAMHVELG